jgi:hypothetical protein
MMYLRDEDLAKLKSNIASFTRALPSSNQIIEWLAQR